MSDITTEEDAEKDRKIKFVCDAVAEGLTLRKIAEGLGCSAGTILGWIGRNPKYIEQYTRARDLASDIFESNAIDAAYSATKDNAAADKILVDTLKWAAGNRSPKKYGSKVQADHTSSDGTMTPKVTIDLGKLSGSALDELKQLYEAKQE